MTMLLVLFLIIAFVGTDLVVQAVSRRAKARREDPQGTVARLNLPSRTRPTPGSRGPQTASPLNVRSKCRPAARLWRPSWH